MKWLWVGILFLFSIPSIGQESRGLYVNSFNNILGDPYEEEKLLDFCETHHFNYITLYSLYKLDLRDSNDASMLRNFIRNAKENYGIEKVGGAVENYNSASDQLHYYNLHKDTDPIERIDRYNLEFEFWSSRATAGYYCDKYLKPNGLPCTEAGGLSMVEEFLRGMNQLKNDLPELEIEMYIGWTTEEQSKRVAALCDRILPAVYVEPDDYMQINTYNFNAQRNRLKYLASSNKKVRVIPIFNAYNGPDPDLNKYLSTEGTLCDVWDNYYNGYANEREAWVRNIEIEGYQWFKYSAMPEMNFELQNPGNIYGPTQVKTSTKASYRIYDNAEEGELVWEYPEYADLLYQSADHTHIALRFNKTGLDSIRVYRQKCHAVSEISSIPIAIVSPIHRLNKGFYGEPVIKNSDHDILIDFSNISAQEIKLELYDLLGRKKLDKIIKNPQAQNLRIPKSLFNTSIAILNIRADYYFYSTKFSL